MSAVFKREFKSYFTSPIGYIVLAIMFFFAGWFFTGYNLAGHSTSLSGVYGLMLYVFIIALPILTMRLMSDEKRQKTDQALLTAPVSLTGIVLGKYLAAMLLFLISLSITLVFAIVIAVQVTPDWSAILANFIGLYLLGGTVITIGLLVSSLTESQLLACVGTVFITACLMLIDMLSVSASGSLFSTVISFVSLSQRYNDFAVGVISYNNIIFFISMQVLFLFLTVRVLDRKRWS
jgi:ABC-2 type transport system permease protein